MTVANPKYSDMRWDADQNAWAEARAIIGNQRVTLGPQASQQWLDQPDHLGFVIARYRAAAALIGGAESVLEVGCGEGIGAGILAKGRKEYLGIDTDLEAINVANERTAEFSRFERKQMGFVHTDIVALPVSEDGSYDACVSLDVIEHIPAARETDFVAKIGDALFDYGVAVIGTPSQFAEHIASPQSKAGHCNLYTPERLKALMARYFHVVQLAYMQDVSIHFGHEQMAHYILAVGIGPKRG